MRTEGAVRRVSKILILLFGIGALTYTYSCGMSKEEKESFEIPPPPNAIPWHPDEKIRTINSVGKVTGLPKKGYVSVRLMSNRRVYSAEVNLDEEVPVDSEVKISQVDWPLTSAQKLGSEPPRLVITEIVAVK
jgi:hypothetical protein